MTDKAAKFLEKAVPLRLSFRSFGVRKIVGARQVTESDTEATLRAAVETGVATEADALLVNASKRTIDCAEFREVARVDNEIRNTIERYSLPSEMAGVFFVPLGLVDKVESVLKALKIKREAAVAAFLDAYPAAVKAAAERLNGLFDPANYPDVDVVASKFSFDWHYVDMLTPTKLANVSTALYEAEKKKAAEHWAEAAADVETALRTSFAELVTHLAEQMTPSADGKKKVLHERALDRFKGFLDLFAAKNLTEDHELDALVTEAKGLVEGVSAKELRTDEDFKEAIRMGFKDLESRVKPLLVAKPARSIVFAPEPVGTEAVA